MACYPNHLFNQVLRNRNYLLKLEALFRIRGDTMMLDLVNIGPNGLPWYTNNISQSHPALLSQFLPGVALSAVSIEPCQVLKANIESD